MGTPFSLKISEIADLGLSNLPKAYDSGAHLIYSSPATLAFNSPGAEGFGVKRAGLAIPDSIMLLVSPACCGRNTTGLGSSLEYQGRFFYLIMDDNDIVTGKHLNKISDAVKEIVEGLEKKPSVVMICITCVDALLGTDMERVCNKASEAVGIPVRPCYMYALTREGRKPPMVHVRQSLYSLLQPMKKRPTSVNLLGFFAGLQDDCELYDLLKSIGVKTIREIGKLKTYDEYLMMAEANFNLVLNSEARFAAGDLEQRLSMPSIEIRRLYQIDKIESQYKALAAALGVTFDDAVYKEAAVKAVSDFSNAVKDMDVNFAVGEFMNGDPFEMALSLVKEGFKVSEVYGTIGGENWTFVEMLAELSPETRVFSNLDPSMTYYDENKEITFTIGKDAAYYNPKARHVLWHGDIQPYGYAGVRLLFEHLTAAAKEVE